MESTKTVAPSTLNEPSVVAVADSASTARRPAKREIFPHRQLVVVITVHTLFLLILLPLQNSGNMEDGAHFQNAFNLNAIDPEST